MLSVQDPEILSLVPDYRINLFSPAEIKDAHSATMAKHATMADYRRATGFEALMGYLYLKEDFSRILELVHAGLEKEEI